MGGLGWRQHDIGEHKASEEKIVGAPPGRPLFPNFVTYQKYTDELARDVGCAPPPLDRPSTWLRLGCARPRPSGAVAQCRACRSRKETRPFTSWRLLRLRRHVCGLARLSRAAAPRCVPQTAPVLGAARRPPGHGTVPSTAGGLRGLGHRARSRNGRAHAQQALTPWVQHNPTKPTPSNERVCSPLLCLPVRRRLFGPLLFGAAQFIRSPRGAI